MFKSPSHPPTNKSCPIPSAARRDPYNQLKFTPKRPIQTRCACKVHKGGNYFNNSNAISSPPTLSGAEGCLRKLSLTYTCISRESFSVLLKRCPSLQEMSLHQVLLFGHTPSLALFDKSSLRSLVASFSQIWVFDPKDRTAPCLLAHFPQLREWHIPSMNRSSKVSLSVMRRDITRYCPLLKDVRFNQGTPSTTPILLAKTFAGLESCTMSAKVLSSSTVLGLIAHQNSLTSVTITVDMVAQTQDNNNNNENESGSLDPSTIQWLYMIPRLCHRLQVMSLESSICDISEIEGHVWACEGLCELQVRFKDLDASEDVDLCLELVRAWRRSPADAALVEPIGMDTIATRVARHLFKFKQLKMVWLGVNGYHLSRSITK